ncbi:MAG: hypothetical protein AAF518_27790 [Spirochaetota bacterium]
MPQIPIQHLHLYKHGVGFIKRRGEFAGSELVLEFDKTDINDVLKSLSIVDHSDSGRVLSLDYDTPEKKANLLKKTLFNGQEKSDLFSLLDSCRGKKISLVDIEEKEYRGTYIACQPSGNAKEHTLLSILLENGRLLLIPFQDIEELSLEDKELTEDLVYYLSLLNSQEKKASLLVRLNHEKHDLEISYTSPAPTWKMTYRINTLGEDRLTLSAWCIFENTYDEDLVDISLTLTSGMPISFVYQLYKSNLPSRLEIKEEERTIQNPIEFEEAAKSNDTLSQDEIDSLLLGAGDYPLDNSSSEGKELLSQDEIDALLNAISSGEINDKSQNNRKEKSGREYNIFSDSMLGMTNQAGEFSSSTHINTHEKEEAFAYSFNHPISVNRGKSAMIPLFAQEIQCSKELIYNRVKYKAHPIFVVRFANGTGFVLESGPVTLFEGANYSGESILKMTPKNSDSVLSYAVDLSVHIKETFSAQQKLHSIHFEKNDFVSKVYEIITTQYTVLNKSPQTKKILIEHNKLENYELFETRQPKEQTLNEYRIEIEVKGNSSQELRIRERKLVEVKKQTLQVSYDNLEKLAKADFLDKTTLKKLKPIFDWQHAIVKIDK